MLLEALLIGGVWVILLPILLFHVSDEISLIGLYHNLKTKQEEGEPFFEKLKKIGKCNAYLSLPLIFSFSIVIKSTIGTFIKTIEVIDAFKLSLPITLVTLLALRILANPSNISNLVYVTSVKRIRKIQLLIHIKNVYCLFLTLLSVRH